MLVKKSGKWRQRKEYYKVSGGNRGFSLFWGPFDTRNITYSPFTGVNFVVTVIQ